MREAGLLRCAGNAEGRSLVMRYAIRHRTRFKYAFPVRFARCNLRLRPIDWGGQTTQDHALLIEPATAQSGARASGHAGRGRGR